MSEKLNDLYAKMERLQIEGQSLNSDEEKRLSMLEEEIIKREILPIVENKIEPILRQVRRELVLVVDYVPGLPVRVRLSRNRKFVDKMKDAVDITDPEVEHEKYGPKEAQGPRAPISRLRITFPDGSFIHETTAADTFCRFVKEVAGAERVRSLRIKRCKIFLVSNTLDKKYGNAQKSLGNGLYLNTHTTTEAKIEDIRKIAKAFKIKLKVEPVDKFAKSRIGVRNLTGL